MTLEDIDRALLWHPFTPMREWIAQPPLVIDRAEGNELIDIHGNRYLDGVSSLWVNVHGHAHPAINAAIRAQLDKVAHSTLLGLGSTPSILLAQKLVAIAPPGLTRVFFSDSGSTAVEVALKIAFQFQQLRGQTARTKFLALTDAYHGDTIGSVSLGGIDTFHQIFRPLLFQTVHCSPTVAALEQAIDQHGRQLAALILEPLVQGAAGMHLSPPGLLRTAAQLCRKHGILLIADEVATGFGRTGTMFACEQEGVTPDLMTVAKGLSGGYLPVAATLATDQVFSQFLGADDQRLTFFHGHSFGGNPLGCAAAIASLDLFAREQTLENLPPKIALLRTRLEEEVKPLQHVFEIRQKGLMVGIELRQNREHPYPDQLAIGARVCSAVRRHGVILRPLGPVVVLMPPLSITADQIRRLVTSTASAISEVTHGPLPLPSPPPPPPSRGPNPIRGLFITGTDTGVGKTAVATALLRLLARRNLKPTPFKPVETGAQPDPQDALALRSAAERSDLPLSLVCPFTFAPPIAPAAAARAAGQPLSLPHLVASARHAAQAGEILVVESAGGLLAPYSENSTAADLAASLGLPVLLVARNGLGTINHTALAIGEIRRRNLPLAGLILVDTSGESSPDRASNAELITALTGVKPLGVLPHIPGATADALADAMAAFVPDPARLI